MNADLKELIEVSRRLRHVAEGSSPATPKTIEVHLDRGTFRALSRVMATAADDQLTHTAALRSYDKFEVYGVVFRPSD